ncbi:hypothetical protein RGQ29_003626 [Quercus rubra]|uniref:Dof zinc finger protein n=1 Tax=Quercus rubra TaxID=3512 RepID=A0AAN7ECI6_QUERU|nr:hypothetical protein RGQ29_003626 [Quercus rubra]
MQDIQAMGGGRLFGGGDRRTQTQNHQALKCPRCDSLNTKFCYYNNYNLSQPRHFCKSCRRYWTKGGVLRNVPVGGGCRKAKRSKPKPNSSDASTPQPQRREPKSNSHSSSESSSLTATTNTATEAVSAVTDPSLNSASNLLNVQDSKLFVSSSSYEQGLLEQGSDCGIFSEIGSFTSLITAPSNETLAFGFNTSQSETQEWQNHHHHHQQQQKGMGLIGDELKMQEEITGGLLDQTVQVDLSSLQNRSSGGGFGSLDWQASTGDQVLFDLPNTVDQAYWNQSQCLFLIFIYFWGVFVS